MFSSDQVDSYFHVVGKSSQYGLLELRRKISLYVSMICISQLRWVMRSDVKIYIKKRHSIPLRMWPIRVCMRVGDVCEPIDSCDMLHPYTANQEPRQTIQQAIWWHFFFFSDLLVFQKIWVWPSWTASSQHYLQSRRQWRGRLSLVSENKSLVLHQIYSPSKWLTRSAKKNCVFNVLKKGGKRKKK